MEITEAKIKMFYNVGTLKKGEVYTVEELLEAYEELTNDYESLKDEYDDYVAMVQDNYTQVPVYRQV